MDGFRFRGNGSHVFVKCPTTFRSQIPQITLQKNGKIIYTSVRFVRLWRIGGIVALSGKVRKIALKYILIQFAVILTISALLFILGKSHKSYSLLLGGLICILPNLYFALNFFKHTGAQEVRKIITSFYIGEVVKFILTILFFWIALKFLHVHAITFFIGFIVAQITFWFVALIYSNTKMV